MKKTTFAISAFLLLSGAALAQGVEYKELKKKLQYGNMTACLDAVLSAGKLNDAQAVKLLEIALENRKWEVRQSSVIALGKIKGKPAIELLFDSLNDLSLNVVAEAVRTIAQSGDPYVMEKLKHLLKKDYVLRFNAMAILGLMKNPEGRSAFNRFFKRQKSKGPTKRDQCAGRYQRFPRRYTIDQNAE